MNMIKLAENIKLIECLFVTIRETKNKFDKKISLFLS